MTTQPDKCREQFEKFITEDDNYSHRKHKTGAGNYLDKNASAQWTSWQAAWNAATVQPTKPLSEFKQELIDEGLITQEEIDHIKEKIVLVQPTDASPVLPDDVREAVENARSWIDVLYDMVQSSGSTGNNYEQQINTLQTLINKAWEIPEVTAEDFIQAAIGNAPEPLKRLGEYLAELLDSDDWNTVEPMLLAATVATQPQPTDAPRQAALDEGQFRDIVLKAMNHEWGNWCGDTGCFPCDFDWRGGNGTLSFTAGKWAGNVSDHIFNSQAFKSALQSPAVLRDVVDNETNGEADILIWRKRLEYYVDQREKVVKLLKRGIKARMENSVVLENCVLEALALLGGKEG